MTLGLYNSYDPVKFHEAHRRALARAGPLCLAYDANLATFGFPYPPELQQPREIVRWVAGTTTIGEGGLYLTELADLGRFQVFEFPRKGFPPQLGAVVVTTSSPEKAKTLTASKAAGMLSAGKSLLLVFGLGPHGLEETEVGRMAAYHLDVTAKGYALETATALGAVPAMISAFLSGPGQAPEGPPG
jgi:hypothetical protein